MSCPGGLTSQQNGDNFMVVLLTTEWFIAAVSALRSLDWTEGVVFFTFMRLGTLCGF
jgi:hypothetical protein